MAYRAELLAAGLFPLLYWQGKHTRANTQRLPEAAGLPYGLAGVTGQDQADSLKLLVIGESPVAGVGVATYQDSLAAQFAQVLAIQTGRAVHWRAIGKNGSKLADFLENERSFLPELHMRPDLVLLAFGVNDTTGFTSDARYHAGLRGLKDLLERRCNPAGWLISAVPQVGRFPALPQPLRTVLGCKAQALNRATEDFAARNGIRFVTMPELRQDWMASDGFHPSAPGIRAWAQLLSEAYLSQKSCGFPQSG